MKIAYIYPALTAVGGADRVITEKANYFAEKCNYEVYIITAHQNGQPLFFPLSKKVKHIDLGVNFDEQYKHSFFMRGYVYFKLLRIYKKKMEELLKFLKLDFTISAISREIDFLTSIDDGSIKIVEAHVSKIFLRNLHLMKNKNILYQITRYIWTKRLESAIKEFAALIVLTTDDAKHWENIKKAIVIPNSLPFYPDKTSNCESKKIISVGRLNEQKGYNMLLKAWQNIAPIHPEWSIHIYGNGELKGELLKEIESKRLSNSFFIEEPVTNITDKYSESSFYVMSSRFEGFGMVLIEAMACGLPTISFDCPNGPADIIANNEDGYLVTNGNIAELAEKINYLIENEETRKSMGIKARENVKRYLPDKVISKWIELFESLKNQSTKK